MRIEAPAKLNLCLFLGPRRPDGLHELCSLFEPLALADTLTVSEVDDGDDVSGADEVICPGLPGAPADNLAARALAALRERGWDAPPLRIEIDKRIPVAAGLGGGSADAAAILRLAAAPGAFWSLFGHKAPDALDALAAELGADVPSQLDPGLALVRGAGERIEPFSQPAPHAVVLLPGGGGLGTADVFAEADRLGLGRTTTELDDLAARLRDAAGSGAAPLDYADLLANDLEPAACSLRPDVGAALEALRGADAPFASMTGSGPTVFGLFPSLAEAERAAAGLDRNDAIVCEAGRVP